MLSDHDRLLLSAYVDGQLHVRQRKAAQRLLHRSADARQLVEKLQQDSARLRQLPGQKLSASFSARVLELVAKQKLQPRTASKRPVPYQPIPLWAGVAAAAALLFAVGSASYVYFSSAADDQMRSIAESATGGQPARTVPTQKREQPSVPVQPSDADPTPPPQIPEKAPRPEVARDGNSGHPAEPENTPPDADPEALLASPSPKMEMFRELGDPRLALVLKVRELDQEKPRQRLQEEIKKGGSYRIVFRCLETARAFDRLRDAFKAQGIRLLIDQVAQERLKRRLNTNYVLYTENLAPDQLSRALQHVGREDKKAESKRRGDGQFDLVELNQMVAANRQQLSKLLGADLTQLELGKQRTTPKVDIRKPLADDTADKVLQSLKGQGPPRPETANLIVRPGERLAIVLAYNPPRSQPAQSKEVRAFLENRQEPRAGTLQMIVVLRGSGGG